MSLACPSPARGAVPKPLIVAVCLVVLAISAAVLCRHLRSRGGTAAALPKIEWHCERCQAAFQAPASGGVPRCPRCGEVGACIYRYRCAQCDAAFEAFRTRARPGQPMEMKSPGGEWTSYSPEALSVRCPKCGGDAVERVSPPEL